jgi:2-dehydropantoate 2-reductase
MKIAIVGTGGIGGYFGGLLAKSGQDITFVARGEQYQSLKKNGLKIKSVIGNFAIKPIKIVNSISKLSPVNLVLFTVKTYDTKNSAQELNKIVTPKTIIITFQNGVTNDFEIKKYVPQAQVFPGVCYVISTRTAPGVITQSGGLRKLIFGDRNNPHNQRLMEIESMMMSAGINASYSDDITRDLWKKFVFICAFSGMTAYVHKPIGEVLKNPKTHKMYETVVRECIQVAKALQVNLPEDIFEVTMKITENTVPESKSSLLVDIENGRITEIETLNGTLIQLAKKAKIPVPVNEVIFQKLS